jgi:hypothetical protein
MMRAIIVKRRKEMLFGSSFLSVVEPQLAQLANRPPRLDVWPLVGSTLIVFERYGKSYK